MQLKILPAFNGDCILLSFDNDGIKNILIDGGIPRNYRRNLKTVLEQIRYAGQSIDLLIVTHIDDDHIGGIKELYQDTKLDRSFIKRIWFNSGNLLSDYFQAKREEEREVKIILDSTTEMSVKQGITLENSLIAEKQWLQELIQIKLLPQKVFNATITVLSPRDEELNKLHKKWEVETDKTTEMSKKEHSDFTIPISDLVIKDFEEDKAVPNGSSIAVLVEIAEKKALLLADSHPSVIARSLRQMGYNEDQKLKVDVVKVSHHGSKANTSPELLSLIECNRFVVSTDGNKHGLPNKEAVARIIAQNPGCNIYFNYDGISEKMFLPQDKEHYKFNCISLSKANYLIEL